MKEKIFKKEEKLLSNKQSAHDPSANLKHNISLMKVEVPLKKRKVANPSSKIIALTFDATSDITFY